MRYRFHVRPWHIATQTIKSVIVIAYTAGAVDRFIEFSAWLDCFLRRLPFLRIAGRLQTAARARLVLLPISATAPSLEMDVYFEIINNTPTI